jgi:hypothetical protein
MDFMEIRWKDGDWINLVQDRDQWYEPLGFIEKR